jgi:ribosomal protein S18 acetylase RimI-like enzyme
VVRLRDARPDDGHFLVEMLAIAAVWRPDVRVRMSEEILQVPEFAHYIVDWPRPGDVGVVATKAGQPVGATWYRFLSRSDRGYGYVADDIPEITIGVSASSRGCGVGESLLRRLIERAQAARLPAVSLSVEEDNPAMRLYERLDFAVVERSDGAATMLRRLDR